MFGFFVDGGEWGGVDGEGLVEGDGRCGFDGWRDDIGAEGWRIDG